MYLRMPQGFLAASDAYTHRYDEVIKDILYDSSTEESFYHSWDFLTLCAEKGIVKDADKFQVCRDTVTFAGLTITPTGITPSNNHLSAIKDFPTPKDITGARSWLGLVNHIS